MCTVTFISVDDRVFITSNRDESPGRHAENLVTKHLTADQAIHFPLDETSGGSWVALADQGRAVCLLNGGYESFIPDPPYRLSRGLIVLEAAATNEPEHFLTSFPLNDIAPFTLLVYEHPVLWELVWDGTHKHIQQVSADQPMIWSSATLYPPDVRAWRKSLFEEWLNETSERNRESIISFHQMANGDSENDFIMNRNEVVKTLSITSIDLSDDVGSIYHLELATGSAAEIKIPHDR